MTQSRLRLAVVGAVFMWFLTGLIVPPFLNGWGWWGGVIW